VAAGDAALKDLGCVHYCEAVRTVAEHKIEMLQLSFSDSSGMTVLAGRND
jgi:hypothetical protein